MQGPTTIPMTALLLVLLLPCMGIPPLAQAAEAGKPPAVGEAAPALSLKTLDGETVELAKLTDAGPVAVVLLRGWVGYQCPICNRQVGDLISRADAIRDAGGQVVLVYPGPADGLEEHAREFLQGKGIPEGFHFVLDPEMEMVSAWGLRWDAENETAYPATFVVGTDQTVRFAKVSQSHGDRAKGEDVVAAMKGE